MLAELTALWGFAFLQPVLDVFGRSPEQLVFRRADATTVVVFALGLTVVPSRPCGSSSSSAASPTVWSDRSCTSRSWRGCSASSPCGSSSEGSGSPARRSRS